MKRVTAAKKRAAIDEMEELFKALADRTRLRILALVGNNEVCVCRKQFQRSFGRLYVLDSPAGGACCAPRAPESQP